MINSKDKCQINMQWILHEFHLTDEMLRICFPFHSSEEKSSKIVIHKNECEWDSEVRTFTHDLT